MDAPEPQADIDAGLALTKGKGWPTCARFRFNPRLSDAEEITLVVLHGAGLSRDKAEEVLASLRDQHLEVDFFIS